MDRETKPATIEDVKREVCAWVRDHPGCSYAQIARACSSEIYDIPRALRHLEQDRLMGSYKEGRYRRYVVPPAGRRWLDGQLDEGEGAENGRR